MAGVIVDFDGAVSVHRVLRNDILDCLYGKSSTGAKNLIDTALLTLSSVAKTASIDQIHGLFGVTPGEKRTIQVSTLNQAIRIAAQMYSSLANLDAFDELDQDDTPTAEESNRRFSTEIRSIVLNSHPELIDYFNRSAVLIDGGTSVKFGFCSPRAILHFGVLSPNRQSACIRDARARLWELHSARTMANIQQAGLIFATPREDDPTLSSRQITSLQTNIKEIEQEADYYNMRFIPVNSASHGAERLVALAS
jgi:hypothetical protein